MAIDDKQIETLLESGQFDDSTDVTDLVAALNGVEPSKATTETQDDSQADTATETEETKADAQKADAKEPSADSEGKTAPDTGVVTDPDESEGSDSEQDPSAFRKHALYGVLKDTRTTLGKLKETARIREQQLLQEQETLRRQNEELRAKITSSQADVQRAADEAGLVDQHGKPIDVATVDIEKLREDYDGPLVAAIESQQNQIKQLNGVITELRQRDQAREKTDAERHAEAIQRDIDSIPVLAKMQAEDSTMWSVAVSVDKALREDPAWRDKSHLDRFHEVARIVGGQAATPKPPAPADSSKVTETVRKAQEKAASRAVPTSLSEMPSGTPAGQSETDTLEQLPVEQLASKMATMSQAQLDALLARAGG